jgi:hypothetical protein
MFYKQLTVLVQYIYFAVYKNRENCSTYSTSKKMYRQSILCPYVRTSIPILTELGVFWPDGEIGEMMNAHLSDLYFFR